MKKAATPPCERTNGSLTAAGGPSKLHVLVRTSQFKRLRKECGAGNLTRLCSKACKCDRQSTIPPKMIMPTWMRMNGTKCRQKTSQFVCGS
eukprot:2711737-Amphidinium_carterae.1